MTRQFTKEFKEDAVRYYEDHKDLGITACEKNIGTSKTALYDWVKKSKNNNGEVPSRDLVTTKVMMQKKMRGYAKSCVILKML